MTASSALRHLAREIAPLVGAEPDLAERAAILSKADLLSGMVGEFPELQGVMGRYYALDQEEDPTVADAIAAHYKPLGPSDEVPREPVAIARGARRQARHAGRLLGHRREADRLARTLTRFAAPLSASSASCWRMTYDLPFGCELLAQFQCVGKLTHSCRANDAVRRICASTSSLSMQRNLRHSFAAIKSADLLSFFADRLKVHLSEQGARHDLVDAVFALGGDDLLMIVKRVEALGQFLDTEDGANLLTGTKRAINILRIEEKKDGVTYDQAPDPNLLKRIEEKALAKAVDEVEQAAAAAVANEDFAAAMAAMALLRAAGR